MGSILSAARRMANPARIMADDHLPPDEWQASALKSKAHRQMMLCARQVGKSTTMSYHQANEAQWNSDVEFAIIAPTMRQSTRLLRTVRGNIRRTAGGVRPINNAKETLELSNGTTIYAWPGDSPDTIRAATLAGLIIDEAAFVSDETMEAVLPMVAVSGGWIWAASTPGGPLGWMFNEWHAVESAWNRISVTVKDCKRWSVEAIAEMERALGAAAATELYCEWRDAADAVFTMEEIDRILGVGEVEDITDDMLLPEVLGVDQLLAQIRRGSAA